MNQHSELLLLSLDIDLVFPYSLINLIEKVVDHLVVSSHVPENFFSVRIEAFCMAQLRTEADYVMNSQHPITRLSIRHIAHRLLSVSVLGESIVLEIVEKLVVKLENLRTQDVFYGPFVVAVRSDPKVAERVEIHGCLNVFLLHQGFYSPGLWLGKSELSSVNLVAGVALRAFFVKGEFVVVISIQIDSSFPIGISISITARHLEVEVLSL